MMSGDAMPFCWADGDTIEGDVTALGDARSGDRDRRTASRASRSRDGGWPVLSSELKRAASRLLRPSREAMRLHAKLFCFSILLV